MTEKPFGLTDRGRSQALAFLGVDALPPRCNWTRVQAIFLAPKALGLSPLSPEERKQIGQIENLRVALVLKCCGQNIRPLPTLFGALNALFRKELHLQPRNSRPDELRAALLRCWLNQPTLASEPKPPQPKPEGGFDLTTFAKTVQEAARSSPTGRFGENKVFISHVWRSLNHQGSWPGLGESGFKERLVEAHQQGLLALSRADLVEAMDPEDVRNSETHYLNASFHFVQI